MKSALLKISSTFRKYLLSGFSWNVLASMALQGSVLVSSIIVARLLGMVSFGSYALIVSTAMAVAAVAQGSSGLVATKLVGERFTHGAEHLGSLLQALRNFAFTMGAIAAILLFSLAEVLAVNAFARPELTHPLRLVAVATFFLVFAAYQMGALQGFGAFRETSRVSVVAGLSYVALTALGAHFGDVAGALWGFVGAHAIRAILLAHTLREVRRAYRAPHSAVVAESEFRPLLRFALPAGLAGAITMLCLWLVTVLVSRLPDGLAMVAVFSVAQQLRLAVLQLPSLLNTVSFSAMSRLKGQDRAGRYGSIFWSNAAINAGFSTVTVAVLIGMADLLLSLYGQEFGDGRWLLIVLLLSVIPESIAMSLYQLVQSAGYMWQSFFFIVIPRDGGYLASAALVIPKYGVLAAAAAYLAAQVLSLVCTAVLARRSATAVF